MQNKRIFFIPLILTLLLLLGFINGRGILLRLGIALSDVQQSSVPSALPRESGEIALGLKERQDKPVIISREEWRAKAPSGKMKTQIPSFITIHHTASPQQKSLSIEEKIRKLQSFSQSPGLLATGRTKPAWPDIPYHFYIAVDGQIAEGRDLKFAGDTNTDYDPTGHILIVLEGNFEVERPTPSQLKSLYQLTNWLAANWHIDTSKIKGHKDYAATVCPGKNLEEEVYKIQKSMAEQKGE